MGSSAQPPAGSIPSATPDVAQSQPDGTDGQVGVVECQASKKSATTAGGSSSASQNEFGASCTDEVGEVGDDLPAASHETGDVAEALGSAVAVETGVEEPGNVPVSGGRGDGSSLSKGPPRKENAPRVVEERARFTTTSKNVPLPGAAPCSSPGAAPGGGVMPPACSPPGTRQTLAEEQAAARQGAGKPGGPPVLSQASTFGTFDAGNKAGPPLVPLAASPDDAVSSEGERRSFCGSPNSTSSPAKLRDFLRRRAQEQHRARFSPATRGSARDRVR